MGLVDDIGDFREPTTRAVGLKRNPTDCSTDNLLLYTSTYLALISPDDREREREAFGRLVALCEIEPGLYRRYPGHTGLNSHDDLQGLAVSSYLMGYPYAKEILTYGFLHDWSWNTEHPGEWAFRSWLSRILGFVPLLRHCARMEVGMVGQILLALAFLVNCFERKEETSGRCLLRLRAVALQGSYGIVDVSIAVWQFFLSKRYPGGWCEIYGIYFGDHPFTWNEH